MGEINTDPLEVTEVSGMNPGAKALPGRGSGRKALGLVCGREGEAGLRKERDPWVFPSPCVLFSLGVILFSAGFPSKKVRRVESWQLEQGED